MCLGPGDNSLNISVMCFRSLDKGMSCDPCAWVQETGNFVEFRSRADK